MTEVSIATPAGPEATIEKGAGGRGGSQDERSSRNPNSIAPRNRAYSGLEEVRKRTHPAVSRTRGIPGLRGDRIHPVHAQEVRRRDEDFLHLKEVFVAPSNLLRPYQIRCDPLVTRGCRASWRRLDPPVSDLFEAGIRSISRCDRIQEYREDLSSWLPPRPPAPFSIVAPGPADVAMLTFVTFSTSVLYNGGASIAKPRGASSWPPPSPANNSPRSPFRSRH